MKLHFINFMRGSTVLCAKGSFPERILNIAKEKGIFVQNIIRDEEKIFFTVSDKGAKILLSLSFDNLSLDLMQSSGLPHLLLMGKSRLLFFIAPPVVLLLIFLSTLFIWNVNVIDATPEREEMLLSLLSKEGVKRGALKHTIDPSEVKKRLLLSDESLLWVWVDIKGSSAIVRFAERTMPPEVIDENEGCSIVSSSDAVITKIIATQGTPLVSVGDKVKKGDTLIEGTIAKNSEELKPIHATGVIFGSVLYEKEFKIPKTTCIRTPTGQKTQHLTVKISNFPVKLFINSRILYPNYDIIESKRKIKKLPVTFTKTEYVEVSLTYEENDTDFLIRQAENDFIKTCETDAVSVSHIQSQSVDCGDYILLTVSLLCEEDIAKERRIYLGENNTVLFS